MDASIVLIIINYQKPELVANLLASTRHMHDGDQVLTLIVDNAASTASRQALAPLTNERVHVLFESENLGYFGGAQRALDWIRGRALNPDWVIVSNSDIEIHQKDFWRELLHFPLDGAPVGVIAPAILSLLGNEDQNPFYVQRPKARTMRFYRFVFSHTGLAWVYSYLSVLKSLCRKWLAKKIVAAALPRTAMKIYAPHGAFIAFSRVYFERGCDFRHGAFLFNEEFTVAENCRAQGMRVLYAPTLCVHHAEHGTMGWPNRKILHFHREASSDTVARYFS